MQELITELGAAATAALVAACGEHAALSAPMAVQGAARPEFGDLQIAGCLQLAKPLGKKPRDLAAIVLEAVTRHEAVAKAELAGPGYVNLTLRTEWLAARVLRLLADPRLGLRGGHEGDTVVVDFSSPNIAKPMHVGHIRSTIIGDALQRVLRAAGYRVISDNHLGDWGTQFGKLIVAYRRWLDRDAYQRDPIAELVRIYQKYSAEEKAEAQALGIVRAPRKAPDGKGAEAAAPADAPAAPGDEDGDGDGDAPATPEGAPPLLLEARAELAKLQQGDGENLALWREFVTVSMGEFARTYARLGVRFDEQLGESFYNDRLAALVEDLLGRGIAERSRGAVICQIEGEPAPLLIRKGDGSFLYGTTDIATIEHRVKTWAPSRILYVVGAPQQLHFRQLFAVARRMGHSCQLEHVSFGSILSKDPQTGKLGMFRTREGGVLLLDTVLDEAVRRAEVVARAQNEELSEHEVKEVARVVGLGAVKYNDLSRDRDGDVVFDYDTALNLKGNTAPYIQYAYARVRSIARKAGAAEAPPAAGQGAEAAGALVLQLPAERLLARRLLDFPQAVEQVVRTAKPHHLTEYLFGLAGVLSTFYNEVPVLKAEPAERASRLLLLEAVARTLRYGLSLLGIEVLERM